MHAMCMCVHVHACMHTYRHTNYRGFPQKPNFRNFAILRDHNKMWDLPNNITGGLVATSFQISLVPVREVSV